MSHYLTGVVLPHIWPEHAELSQIEEHVGKILAPYDENTEVAEYQKPCYCIGSEARSRARAAAETATGKTIATLRDEFWAGRKGLGPDAPHEEAWKEHIAAWSEAEEAALAVDPDKESPWKDCEACKGSGAYLSTYNPRSKWDWWTIGGRWTGNWDEGYDPSEDPANFEECWLCHGTGSDVPVPPLNIAEPGLVGSILGIDKPAETEEDAVKQLQAVKEYNAWKPEDGVCNGCGGVKDGHPGRSLKHAGDWVSNPKDVILVSELLARDNDSWVPFAIATFRGEWAEVGEMGWWGMVKDEKAKSDWHAQARAFLEQYRDHYIVAVDIHI